MIIIKIAEPNEAPAEQVANRESEQELFWKLIEDIKNPQSTNGRAVLFTGIMGIGKSSLKNKLIQLIDHHNEKNDDYFIVSISEKFLENSSETEIFERVFKKIVKKCESLKKRLRRDISSLDIMKILRAFSAIFGGKAPSDLRSSEYHNLIRRILDTLKEIGNEFSKKKQILVIFIDDLQKSSVIEYPIFDTILNDLPKNIFLISFFRREFEEEELKKDIEKYNNLNGIFKRFAKVHDLQGLDSEGIIDFVKLRHDLKISPRQANLLKKMVNGHPLHLTFGINAIVESGKDFNEESIKKYFKPEIRDQVLDIIINLPKEHKEVLEASSILWEHIEPEAVAQILDKKIPRILETLRYFAIKVPQRDRFYPEAKFRFWHDIFREETRKIIRPKHLDVYHGKAAEYFESIFNKKKEISIYRKIISCHQTAEHYFLANNSKKALKFCYITGDTYHSRWELNLAYEFYLKALQSAENIDDYENQAGAIHQIGRVLQDQGNLDEA
ncbi:MAG: P-loop NTPase fold protein, partial [Candidatus Methanofastidiosia archaeon]